MYDLLLVRTKCSSTALRLSTTSLLSSPTVLRPLSPTAVRPRPTSEPDLPHGGVLVKAVLQSRGAPRQTSGRVHMSQTTEQPVQAGFHAHRKLGHQKAGSSRLSAAGQTQDPSACLTFA